MRDPFQVVRDFEAAVAEYTGAPYCVSVSSCTMALLLAVAWHLREEQPGIEIDAGGHHPIVTRRIDVEIPKRTYVGVPMSIIHAGGRPTFRDDEWDGAYPLRPLPVWDSARWFTGGMYQALQSWEDWRLAKHKGGPLLCVSFHASKTLGDTQGGAILHDNPEADGWLRRARFDGRREGERPADQAESLTGFDVVGWHCYMSPDVAARLLVKLRILPRHNGPLPNDEYPDLSKMEIFK